MKDKVMLSKLNVPWITKEGHIDLLLLPIDSTSKQALSGDEQSFRSACRMLSSMAIAGREEACVFLYGLLKFYEDDLTKKESIVEALGHLKSKQAAALLFEELNRPESSNSTRGYLKIILKALKWFPPDLVKDRFQQMLSDRKWSYRMKQKFREIIEEAEYRE